jgi:hypothetical protein
MFQGVTFPSMHVMLARWIPPSERSKFSVYVYAGKLQAKDVGKWETRSNKKLII